MEKPTLSKIAIISLETNQGERSGDGSASDQRFLSLMCIVVTGRARLSGFRVGLGVQNPGLATLGFSGFGLFRALGFSGLFQAFYSFFGPLRG